MAFAVKYSKKFQRMGITKTYRIDILSEAGGAVVVPDRMGADPLQLKTLASKRDENKIVIGSELAFEFVLLKRNGEADYDPLFESEYRTHIVKYYDDDTSELLWQGYLQPENMYKSMFESNLHIYLSSSDALKDLADYDFLDDGDIVTGRLTGLEILKLCLTNLDQASQFQYNFVVKLGTKHDGQGVNDNALKDITYDTRRFANIQDGKTEIDNCLTVIEKILTPYSCTLQQWEGKYYIINRHEAASNYYTYNWALAFQSKAVSNDSVNIDAYKFKRNADISLMPPIKEVGLKLYNRNIGGSLVANMNDYDAGVWDYSNYDSAFDDTKDYMSLTAAHDAGAPGVSNGYVTLVNDVSIQKLTEGDYLKLRFSYRHMTSGIGMLDWPQFKITVIKDGVDFESIPVFIMNNYLLYESEVSIIFKLTGNVGQTFDYNFKLEIITNDTVDDYEIRLINFDLTKATIVEGENIEDVIFDQFYRAQSTKGKIKAETQDFYFGDSGTLTDFAALVYSGAVTDEWNREGEADAQQLLYLWAKNFLISRQDYTEYINCEIKDSEDNITSINYIEWDGKKYHIVSYEKSYRPSWIKLHLKQWLTDDLNVNWNIIPLYSVDGEGSGASSPYIPPVISGITSWGNIEGTLSNQSDLNSALALKAPIASPTFTGTVTAPSLIVEDLSDGYVPYQVAATDKLGNSPIYTDGASVGIGITGPNEKLEIYKNATAQCATQYGNSNTGSGAGNGFVVGVETSGNALIWQRENSYMRFGTNATERMRILSGGNVGIGTDAPGYLLDVNGIGRFVGNLYGDASVQHKDFVTGWGGNNWQVTSTGDAEFDNLLIRGSARFMELIIDQLAIIAGSQLMSSARGKILSVDIGNSKVTLEDPNSVGACAFTVNDFFWIKNVDIDHSLFSDCRGQITAIVGTTLTLNFAVAGANGSINDISEGDVIVQRGNSLDSDRQAMIYKTVSDADSPFERYLIDIDSLAAFDDPDNIAMQTGNLESIASHDIVPVNPGFGMYSDNVYLSGTIVAEAGEIGGLTIDSDAVYTGTKHDTDDWSDDGYTLMNDGSIHAPNFYVNDDGEAGIRAKELIYAYTGVSDTVILNHDVETFTIQTDYTLLKTITLGNYLRSGRTLRIKFDLNSEDDSHTVYGKIYNGAVPVGIERTTNSSTYQTFSEDIVDWDPGDEIRLYGKQDAGGIGCNIRNFRICGDLAVIVDEVTGTNS